MPIKRGLDKVPLVRRRVLRNVPKNIDCGATKLKEIPNLRVKAIQDETCERRVVSKLGSHPDRNLLNCRPVPPEMKINTECENDRGVYVADSLNHVYSVFDRLKMLFPDLKIMPKCKCNDAIDNIRDEDSGLYAYPCLGSVGICYSGGYDSILLIIQAAEKGETIVPIRLGVNMETPEVHLLAEYALLQLRRKYPNRICRSIMPIKNIEFDQGDVSGYFIQPSLAYSLAYLPNDVHSCLKEIQVGFICKDECISFLDEFENLYKAATQFIYPYNRTTIPLTYPLKKFTKQHVMALFENSRWYYLAITCEQPNVISMGTNKGYIVYYSPCDSCMSCHTMSRADFTRTKEGILLTMGDFTDVHIKCVNAIKKSLPVEYPQESNEPDEFSTDSLDKDELEECVTAADSEKD